MKHEYENEIKCPYCDYEFGDSWEYISDNGYTTMCESCDKTFNLEVIQSVSYTTTRMPCNELDPPEEHEYDEPHVLHNDQDTIDRWKREGSSLYSEDEKLYTLWMRNCKKCGSSDYSKHLPLNSKCPWGQEKKDE